jgi:hypothetical protein
MTFSIWLANANVSMRRLYGVTIKDAGLSENEFRLWRLEGMSPVEVVKWQGEKCGLTPRNEWGWA